MREYETARQEPAVAPSLPPTASRPVSLVAPRSTFISRVVARPPTATDVRVEHALAQVVGARRVARAPAPAPASTGDVVIDALVELRASPLVIDRNTAAGIDSGARIVRYLDTLPIDPESDKHLGEWGHDVNNHVVRICPDGEPRVFQKNAEGSSHRDGTKAWIFVRRGVSVARMRELLVHETNHVVRLEQGETSEANSIGRYKDEFQAYWVAEERNVKDLAARAARVKARVLHDYEALGKRYQNDAAFKDAVDKHVRPDGNVLNSELWASVENATTADEVLRAIRAMSPAERAAARAEDNFLRVLYGKLRDDELDQALFELGASPRVKTPPRPGDPPTSLDKP